MKRLLFSLTVAGIVSVNALADCQSINLVKGNIYYTFNSDEGQRMTLRDGKTLSVCGQEFSFSDFDAIKILPFVCEDGSVIVDYDGYDTKVYIPGTLVQLVKVEINGAHVQITQTADASDTKWKEISYILQGTADNGSFSQSGNYDCTVYLKGLNLTNPSGAAISVDNTRRTSLGLEKDSFNYITDGTGGKQKAAIYSKGNFEIYGDGTLNVTGLTGHAISAKDYITFKNSTFNINGAVKDGLNCNRYFTMESGTINILKTGDDGIQVAFLNDTDRDADDTGSATINGGTINIADITAEAAKCIKCDGDFLMSAGSITATTTAKGTWNSSKSKTKASACIGVDGSVTIDGGTLELKASGAGAKGISCDGNFTMNDGSLTITTSGNMLVYANNTLYQGNYNGNTDRLDSDAKSSAKGVKSDGDIVINGGTISTTTTGTGAEGLESKSTLTINDGNIRIRAYDDAINSSSHLYIKGGLVDVISTNNDGIDSNGNLYISGGTVMAFGSSSPECGLDANEEEGYTVYFTGGYILASGGSHSYPKNSSSTQPYVTVSTSLNANSSVNIGSGNNTYYTFTIPADFKASSGQSGNGGRPGGQWGSSGSSTVLISVPELKSGQSYTVKNGSSTLSATARLTGSSSGRPF